MFPKARLLSIVFVAAMRLHAGVPTTAWSHRVATPPTPLFFGIDCVRPLVDDTLFVAGSTGSLRLDGRGGVVSRSSAAGCTVDPLGGVVLPGSDGSLSKVDGVTGAPLWRATPSGNVDAVVSRPGGDLALALADGTVQLLSGATGATLWGPVASLADDTARSPSIVTLLADASGDLVVSGFTRSGDTTWSEVVAKIGGADGRVLWRSTGLEADERGGRPTPLVAALDPRGDVLLAGSLKPGVAVLKLAAEDGSVRWSVPGVASFTKNSLTVTETGIAIVGDQQGALVAFDGGSGSRLYGPIAGIAALADGHGGFYVRTGGQADGLVRYGARSGAPLWGPVTYHGAGFDVDATGDLLVAAFPPAALSRRDRRTGALLWEHVEAGPAFDSGAGVHADAAGNVLSVTSIGPVKYAANGQILWGPTPFPRIGFGAVGSALAPDGGVVVWGQGIAAFDGTTGTLRWSVPTIGDLVTAALGGAVDGEGNLYVSGAKVVSTRPVVVQSFATASYDRTGRLRWVTQDVGEPFVALTADGSLLLEGRSLTRLDPATGRVLESHAFPLPEFRQFAAALVPGAGLVVAGAAGSPQALLALDSRSGAVLWGPLPMPDAPASLDANPATILPDGGGDFFVTLRGAAGPILARYEGRSGRLRWSTTVPRTPDKAPLVQALPARAANGDVGLLVSQPLEIARFDSASGAVLWEPTPVQGEAYGARAIAATGHGFAILSATDRTSSVDDSLGFLPLDLGTAFCGDRLDVALPVQNARPPVRFEVDAGTLPPGLALDAARGRLSGTFAGEGTYPFRIRATDAAGQVASLVLDAQVEGDPGPVAVTRSTSGCQVTLHAEGPWTSVLWLPGGESGASLTVTPDSATAYGVVVTENGGCTRRASLVVSPPPGCPVTSIVERRWILPSSARTSGLGGSFFTTDLLLANPTASTVTARVKLLGHDVDGRSGTEKSVTIGPGATWAGTDVLGSLFGLDSAYGALLVTSTAPLAASSTTSTPGLGGRFGQSVPLFDEASWITPAASRSVVGVSEDGTTRTNLVLANATDAPLDVTVTLIGADGTVLGSGRFPLRELGMTQVTRVVRALGATDAVRNGRLVLSTTTPGGAFAAYAAAIDEGTNDPRTLEAR